jgi:ribonucleoside-diphosphate reductase alpha chain
MSGINVTKREGHKEQIQLEKLHKVVFEAVKGITGVSASEVEMKSHIQFYEGITTADIQETLIKAASDLITEETPNYQFVAGRLINYHLRKEVYGQYAPCALLEVVTKNVELGFYDDQILDRYTTEEWAKLDTYIKHNRDEDFTYAAMEQWRGKYLVQNRVTGQKLETPQIAYMMIAASLFVEYPAETRMKWVKDYYDMTSLGYISLPTPVMAGVRTSQRQYSSCVLIETGDSLDSINASNSAVVRYVSQRAGIGIGAGNLRALGSPIRGGQAYHTGVTPFFKMFQSAVLSCSQGGVRRGSATLFMPLWHYEIEDILVLKNNKGTDDNRVRHIDYGIQFNKLMYERLISGADITLFSPSDVPGLSEAFFNDQDLFKTLYEEAERDGSIRKRHIAAIDLFTAFLKERKETGRIYLMNVDHCNTHSSFLEEHAPVRMSNLCVEITQTTEPLNDINDEAGRIALCTLSAINWGLIKSPADFEKPCTLAIRGLDALLSHQNYPVIAAELHTKEFRPLGVGIINLAYFLAKNDLKYDDGALPMVDEYAEAWSYHLIKASADLAQEQGPCGRNHHTKYSKGILPIDTYKRDVDQLVAPQERMPWSELRQQLKVSGIRNSTVMAGMPAETSAQIANATNGIEPPRGFISIKQSKDGILRQVVPEFRRLKNKYDLLWDQKDPKGYLKVVAVLQKYMDQSISANTSYNPEHYENGTLGMKDMINDILFAYKMGLKTLYYFNTYDGQGELDVDEMIAKMKDDDDGSDDCDSCTI